MISGILFYLNALSISKRTLVQTRLVVAFVWSDAENKIRKQIFCYDSLISDLKKENIREINQDGVISLFRFEEAD